MKRIWAVLPAWALAACQTVPYVVPEVPVPGQWAHQAPAVVPGAAGSQDWRRIHHRAAAPLSLSGLAWPTGPGRRSFRCRS